MARRHCPAAVFVLVAPYAVQMGTSTVAYTLGLTATQVREGCGVARTNRLGRKRATCLLLPGPRV
jgi:hypothetical protein